MTATPLPPPSHTVRFQRHISDGWHRAICSCGWFANAPTLLECQLRASSHDLWEDVEPMPPANARVT